MSEVLVTGFGAFAESEDNPSGRIATRLDGWNGDGVRIHGLVLPVRSGTVGRLLAAAIERVHPDVVIVTGVTPNRSEVAIERIGINVLDFPIADIDGVTPIDEPIVAGAPPAYFSTLPVKAILAGWQRRNIPAYVSNSAGTYVCNQTFYLARHLTEGKPLIAGLVHIPLPTPTLDLLQLEEAVRTAAVIAATHRGADLRLGAGTTS
jgi:pyroglutamyl-peptidase